ncbi:MAG: hypothetical protein FWB83_06955 [Treponema sp.]|nr:hypothetical protein [Treponema sp.]
MELLEMCSQKRRFSQSRGLLFLSALTVLSVLFSCSLDEDGHPDTGFIPAGEWADDFGGSYFITETKLEFDDGFGFTQFKGDIETAIDFSSGSGVLIIKVNSSETGITNGNYVGVYYKNCTSSHILLANAVDESYAVIEADSIINAKNIFNVDNVNTHVTYWGSGYTK